MEQNGNLENLERKHQLKRLILDVQSKDVKLAVSASERLANFMEFEAESINLDVLIEEVSVLTELLKNKIHPDLELKLSESIFELLWSNRLSENQKTEILIKLTDIESYHVWNYMNDEEYLKITEVKDYFEKNLVKWQERRDFLYRK